MALLRAISSFLDSLKGHPNFGPWLQDAVLHGVSMRNLVRDFGWRTNLPEQWLTSDGDHAGLWPVLTMQIAVLSWVRRELLLARPLELDDNIIATLRGGKAPMSIVELACRVTAQPLQIADCLNRLHGRGLVHASEECGLRRWSA